MPLIGQGQVLIANLKHRLGRICAARRVVAAPRPWDPSTSLLVPMDIYQLLLRETRRRLSSQHSSHTRGLACRSLCLCPPTSGNTLLDACRRLAPPRSSQSSRIDLRRLHDNLEKTRTSWFLHATGTVARLASLLPYNNTSSPYSTLPAPQWCPNPLFPQASPRLPISFSGKTGTSQSQDLRNNKSYKSWRWKYQEPTRFTDEVRYLPTVSLNHSLDPTAD